MAAPRPPPWAAARRPRQETFTSLTAPVQATARCAPHRPSSATTCIQTVLLEVNHHATHTISLFGILCIVATFQCQTVLHECVYMYVLVLPRIGLYSDCMYIYMAL